MKVQIPDIELQETNPYSNGVILVLGDENDLVLEADPLKHQKSEDDQYYTVEDGDTITNLAYAAYGSSKDWRRIADANDIFNPLVLEPGKTLLVPDQHTSRVINSL